MAAALVGREFKRSVIDEGQGILKRLDDLLGRTSFLGLKDGVPPRSLQRLPAPLVGNESDVVGRDGDKKKIIELLLSADSRNNLSVIPIVGMGGIGKTTLAQLVYKDSRVQQHFGLKVWVTISEEFDVFQITKRICKEVTSQECETGEVFVLQSKLNEALAGKRFLFVLDDVWNENYQRWDSLKSAFQSGAHGSRIIVTTRSKVVASTMSNVAMHELELISVEDCWRIFEKHAFDDNQAPTKELHKIGLEIVKRCKGLPLAVKSVAGLLRSTSNPEGWREILDSDIWQLQFQENLKNNIVPALWLSYRFLPPALKRCFAYCSIFPKDYEFLEGDMERIIWLWMAEGLVAPEKGKRMEDVGKAYLQALKSRSFFQPSISSRWGPVMVMHDLVHDLAMFISGEFCFSCGDSNDLSNLGTKSCHLSYSKSTFDLMELGAVSQSREKKLRTLLALPVSWVDTHHKRVLELHELFLKVGGCLRVLSLSEYSITELPDSIGNMKYLRYLDLSYTEIKELPDSICTFYNLQTLLLLECYSLVRLPTRLAALVNLRHLDISGPNSLEEMPPQMCKMKSLQILSDFVLGENGGWRIKELGELPLLGGRLRISGLEYIADVKDVLEANLKDKKFLSELILEWREKRSSQQEREVLEALQPHTNLKKLGIWGYRGTIFPEWVGHESFCNMVEVELQECGNVCMLPPLGQLSSLRRLVMVALDGVVRIGNEFCGSSSTTTNHPFTSLEYLKISSMDSWEEWSFSSDRLGQEGGVFPSLTELEIRNCKKLIVGLPDCHLPSLTALCISSCSKMLGVFVCQSRQEMDTNAFPFLQSIKISLCNKLIVGLPDCHLPSLTRLTIWQCSKMVGVFVCQSRQEMDTNAFPSLQSIEISLCNKLIVGLPDCHLPSLKSIKISRCDEMVSVFVCQSRQEMDTNAFPSLQSISISQCKKLIVGLPDCHLPSLTNLDIFGCSEMVGVFVCQSRQEMDTNAFPSLQFIAISLCNKLIVGLPDCHLPSLKTIEIFECDEMERVFACQSRQEMDTNAFPSLQSIAIDGCKKLECMPEEGLPPSLSSLVIGGCSKVLKQRCQRGTGVDWPKIQHIPRVDIW